MAQPIPLREAPGGASQNIWGEGKNLIVLLGPTGVGKTALALQLANRWNAPILNADSRQIYRELAIGTASPTPQQLAQAHHYFVGALPLEATYSAARFEADALQVLRQEYQTRDVALLSGGSMLYLDAVCHGIDDIPTVDEAVREQMKVRLEQEGIENLRSELRLLDPSTYAAVDLRNPRRIVHALEVYYTSGKPYSSFLGKVRPPRPFRILKIGLNRPRPELFDRINRRVEQMMNDGLLEEVRNLADKRHLNALQTVGYTELFHYLDGEWPLEMAVERIKKNTRVYAKKQLTWFAHDNQIHWFHPNQEEEINATIQDFIENK